MMDDACALGGRRGLLVKSGEPQPVDELVLEQGGIPAVEEPQIEEDKDHEAHLGVSELTNPGESPSNGLAERSVQTFEDHFRTLKAALEARICENVAIDHPVANWLAMHSGNVLSTHNLNADGRTGWGSLHGKEVRERICEFGDVILWYVPRRMRAKIDTRWRYGVFLGRSPYSVQNVVGLKDGTIVRANATSRVIPDIKWNSERLLNIKVTPLDETHLAFDEIEQSENPHDHIEEPNTHDVSAGAPARRVPIHLKDLELHGFTPGCPTCGLHKLGRHRRAQCHKNSEPCRARMYDKLSAAGYSKIKLADEAGDNRTRVHQPAAHAPEAPGPSTPSPPTPRLDEAPTPQPPTENAFHGAANLFESVEK